MSTNDTETTECNGSKLPNECNNPDKWTVYGEVPAANVELGQFIYTELDVTVDKLSSRIEVTAVRDTTVDLDITITGTGTDELRLGSITKLSAEAADHLARNLLVCAQIARENADESNVE